jgi:hypothetical protein
MRDQDLSELLDMSRVGDAVHLVEVRLASDAVTRCLSVREIVTGNISRFMLTYSSVTVVGQIYYVPRLDGYIHHHHHHPAAIVIVAL